MNSTKLIGKIFVPRQKEIDLYGTKAEEIQARVFRKLIHKASATELSVSVKNIRSNQNLYLQRSNV